MKESNLKDKLDQIPQPFDKDALWNKINEEKPRRRKPIFWFWLAPLFLLFIAVGYFFTQESKQSLLTANSNIDQHVDNTYSLKDRDTISEVEQNMEHEVKYFAEAITEISDTEEKKEEQDKNIKSQSKIISTNIRTNYYTNISNQNINSTPPSRNQSLDTPLNILPITHITEDNSYSKISTFDKGLKNIDETNQKLILIKTLDMEVYPLIIYPRKIETFLTETVYNTTLYTAQKWMANLSINFGLENHKFSNERSFIGLETELEALGISFNIDRLIGNWKIGIGVNHNIGNTIIKHDNRKLKYLQGLTGEVTSEINKTTYSLYNQYHRTDISVTLGYEFPISNKLLLGLNTSVGANIFTIAKGDYILESGELKDLETHSEYNNRLGMFGAIGLDLRYQLGKNTIIAIGGNIQSRRAFNATHKINPIYGQLKIARSW